MEKLLITKTEALKVAQDEFTPLCKSWTYTDWDELDWNRIKDLSIRNVLDARKKEAKIAQNSRCLDCPKFLEHVSHP